MTKNRPLDGFVVCMATEKGHSGFPGRIRMRKESGTPSGRDHCNFTDSQFS